MSWWTNLLSRWPSRPAPPLELPARIEIIPGKLAAHVHAHQLDTARGPVPCWTYVTEGLAECRAEARGEPPAAPRHRELVFTLRREPGEPATAVPRAPLAFFATVFQLAFRGRGVDIGDITQTGGTKFFGGHAIYVETQPLPGVPLPPSSMTALVVTDLELRACRSFGFTRVLALLGETTGTYPFAPWSQRHRPDLVTPQFFAESLLTNLPIAPTSPHLCARLDGSRLLLTATRGPWQQQVAKLPAGKPLAFTTGFDPAASGCLLWRPGQRQRTTRAVPLDDALDAALAGPCGTFLAISPGEPADSLAVVEDGFAAKLTAATWTSLHAALVAGQRFEQAVSGDAPALALEWRGSRAEPS